MKVDGMDVRAVKAAADAALAKIRRGGGPMILEMRTYRYRGHSMSDPAKYRSREEVQEMRTQRDPIELFGKRLVEEGAIGEERPQGRSTSRSASSSTRPRTSPRTIPSPTRASSPPTWSATRRGDRSPDDSMPTEILMPALSPTMEEGTLAKWHVREGDEVRSGDIIAEIETDKATMEVEAVDEGRVGKLLVPEGTEHVKVNTPIALLLEDGEDDLSPWGRGRCATRSG